MHPHLIPFWHRYCKAYGWVGVIEDGALGHKGHTTRYQNQNEMETIRWPAQSPDWNVIEALWLDLEKELGKTWGQIADIPRHEITLNTI
ncbi:hypothetical protein HOY82DRAFT_486531 [Tuber indicum]|nr:hypothetical protein HOY82DRAFT_486531 [Tuber indicum]